MLKDSEGNLDFSVAFDLGRMGPAAGAALPVLLAEIDREPTAYLLGRIVGRIARDGDLLMVLHELQAESAYVRRGSLLALEEMGPRASAAVPALRVLLEDSDEVVRRLARRALRSIEGEKAQRP